MSVADGWVPTYSHQFPRSSGVTGEPYRELVRGHRRRSKGSPKPSIQIPSHENLFVDVSAEPRSPKSSKFLLGLLRHENHQLETIHEGVGFARSIIGKGSMISASFTLVASAMGAGCLSLPHMLRRCGMGLGLLLLAAGATLAHISLVILMSCARYTECSSFAELAALSTRVERSVLGQRSLKVDAVIAFYGMAAVLIYLILIGDFFADIVQSPLLFGGLSCEVPSRRSLICVSLVLVFPLSLPKQVSALRYISIVSTSSILFMTIVVWIKLPSVFVARLSVQAAETLTADHVFHWATGDWYAFVQCFAIALFSFNAHTNAVAVATTLERPSAGRIWQVSLVSVLIELTIYSLIATGGYLSFLEETEQDFIRNYPTEDTLMFLVRCIYSVSVLLGIPINLSPVAASLQALARHVAESMGRGSSLRNHDGKLLHVLIVAGVLGLCAGLAIYCEAVADVVGLFGGLFGTFIVLAWPLGIYCRILRKLHSRSLSLPLIAVMTVATALGMVAFLVHVFDAAGLRQTNVTAAVSHDRDYLLRHSGAHRRWKFLDV